MKHRRILALLLALCLAVTTCVFPAAAVETRRNAETAKVQDMLNTRPVPGTAVPTDTADTVIAVGTVDVDTTLNVRSGAGTSYSKVGSLIGGQRVAFYETKAVGSTTWGRMDLGWVSMDYVILDEDLVFTDAGYCGYGEDVLWGYAEDAQMLVIVGEGPMVDYPASASAEYMVPWLGYRSEIRTVLVDYGVTYVGNYTFNDCTALRFAYVSDTVTAMGDGTFTDCISLLDFYLPDTMTTVGGSTFRGCYNLLYAWLPAGLTALSSRMFEGCTALELVVMPADVTEIGPNAFDNCTGLTEISLPEGLSTIGDYAFNSCTGLTHIDFPKSLTKIARGAFDNCLGLESMKFLGNAPTFGSDPFSSVVAVAYYPANNFTWTEAVRQNYGGTLTWKAVTIPGSENPTITGTCGDNLTWTLADGVLTISGTGDMYDYSSAGYSTPAPWYDYRHAITQVILPDGITSIGAYAFYDMDGLTEISIPEGVTSIGECAFYSTGLTACVLPDSVTSIGSEVFYYCDQLASVTLSADLKKIGSRAFSTTALKEITIPAQVEYIEARAFEDTSLEKITFLGDAPSIRIGTFAGVVATAYYPAGNSTWTEDVMENYGGTITWEPYGDSESENICGDNLTWTLADGVLTISGTGDMYDYTGDYDVNNAPWGAHMYEITQVILPEGLTSIGDYAFCSCVNLTALTIPETVTDIGTAACFQSGLTSLEIPGSVETIGTDAFAHCAGLTQVTLGSGVKTIGKRAFAECGDLTTIAIPDSVTAIGSRAFYDCADLVRITLPTGLTAIEDEVFTACVSLTELTIPANVASIGAAVFRDAGLKTVIFLGNAPAIAADSFGSVEANAWYPAGNATWTADVMQNYGGTLTWNTHNIDTEPSVTYTSVSLSMAGDIGLNYYVKLSDDIILDSGAYMQFTFGDQVQTVPMSEALPSEDGTYRFSCAIPAKRMTDVVTGQMYTSDGPVGEAKQYSVKQYCTSMKTYVETNGLTGYDSLLNLLDAMLNYGGYSQLSFGYNTANLANADLSEEAKALPETLDASAYTHSVSGSEEGIAVHSASLLLESKTTIRFYFTLTGDRWIDDFGLTVDGQKARLTESGDLCYVDVPNVAAKDLDTMHTVVFDGGLTVSYCGLSYVNQMLRWSGAAEADVNTAKALYLYNQAANEYFGA